MAYSFRQDDGSVEHGLRRIALGQIASGLDEIDDRDLPMAERVHQVRKRCKKLRGLIRLVRPVFPDYAAENAAFRDTARRLSDIRDAAAMVETCDALAMYFSDALKAGAIAPLRARLNEEAEAAGRGDDLDQRLDLTRAELTEAQARVENWRLDADGWEALAPGLAKTYGRARKGMEAARSSPDMETLHQWRKRVKYHRYHARLLSRMDERLVPAHAGMATDLSEVLGDHHDLHVLEARLAQVDPEASPEAREATVGLVRARRGMLEDEAFRLGQRLLTEPAKGIAARWRPLWETWRAAAPA